jgi:hypothetical protein
MKSRIRRIRNKLLRIHNVRAVTDTNISGQDPFPIVCLVNGYQGAIPPEFFWERKYRGFLPAYEQKKLRKYYFDLILTNYIRKYIRVHHLYQN